MNVAEEAIALVDGDRQADYGTPEQNMADLAKVAEIAFRDGFTAYSVAVFMMGLKFVRAANKPKRDNLSDSCGYALIAERCMGSKENA